MKWQSRGLLVRLKLMALLAVSLVVVGCKLQVVVPPGGRVVSESGNFSCEAGESCTVDVTDVFFDETFRAVPDPGYTFVSWRQRLKGWCAGRNAPCRLTTTGFADTPLLPILDEDYVFYLQPIFARPARWSRLADLPHPGVGTASCVINGKLYVLGGGVDSLFQQPGNIPNHNDEYDPVTNTWRSRAEMPGPRNFAVASVVNGKCYVIGGGAGEAFSDPALTTVQAYDPATDTWENKAPLPEGRHGAASAVVDGKIYVIGGGDSADFGGANLRAAVAIYDPRTNLWRKGAPMRRPRRAAAVVSVGRYIYVMGGLIPGKNWPITLSSVERYDPATDEWNDLEPLPVALDHASAVAYQSEIYVFGGVDFGIQGVGGFRASSGVYRYRPQSNDLWDSPTQMPTPRWLHTSAVLDRQIYLFGGDISGSDSVNRVELYTPGESISTPARAFNCNSAPPVKETDVVALAEGLYSGTLFNCASGGGEQVQFWVDEDGEFHFFPPLLTLIMADMGGDVDAIHNVVGSLQIDGNRFQGSGLQFAPPGRRYFSGGATGFWMDGLVATGKSLDIDGSDLGVAGGQNLEGRWGTDWGGYGYFTLAKLGLPDTSHKMQLVGTWHGSGMVYNETIAWDFDADGLINGHDTSGCEYSGQLRLVDSAYLVYKLDVTVTGCEVAGTYSGILHQETGGNWGDFLSVSLDDGGKRPLSFVLVDPSWEYQDIDQASNVRRLNHP